MADDDKKAIAEGIEKLKQLFGGPPILASENPQAYEALLTEFARAFPPKDFLGWLLVKEMTDQTFEATRFDRYKVLGIEQAHRDIRKLEAQRSKRTLEAHAEIDPNASKDHNRIVALDSVIEGTAEDVDAILNIKGETIQARAFEQKLAYYKIVDGLQADKLEQRDQTLEQLLIHNEALEQRRRRGSDGKTIEGECVEVPEGQVSTAPSDQEPA